jgi:5,6-dimethylbenzimidazole synthase
MSAPSLDHPPVFDSTFLGEFEALLHWRRDVRRFRSDPVEKTIIDRLLYLADQAPSVGNSQPWRIVSVENDACRAAVADNFQKANQAALECYHGDQAELYARLKLAGLKDAPVHFAVFCEDSPEQGHGLGRATMPETLAYSVVGMIQTLWLAARAYGVGLGWVSILNPDHISEHLETPPDWQFIAYLCLGYPEEEHMDPELERHGWQEKTPMQGRLFHR